MNSTFISIFTHRRKEKQTTFTFTQHTHYTHKHMHLENVLVSKRHRPILNIFHILLICGWNIRLSRYSKGKLVSDRTIRPSAVYICEWTYIVQPTLPLWGLTVLSFLLDVMAFMAPNRGLVWMTYHYQLFVANII